MQDGEQPDTSGLSRRDALRRAAAVGGALVWTVPVVQSMSGVAVAAGGSPVIDTRGGPTPSTSTTTPPSNESKTTSTSPSSSSSSSTVPSPDTSVEGTKSSPTPGP